MEADSEPKLKNSTEYFHGLAHYYSKSWAKMGIIVSTSKYTGSNANPIFNEEYKRKARDFNGKEVEITIPAFTEIVFQVASSVPDGDKSTAASANDEHHTAQGHYKAIKISRG